MVSLVSENLTGIRLAPHISNCFTSSVHLLHADVSGLKDSENNHAIQTHMNQLWLYIYAQVNHLVVALIDAALVLLWQLSVQSVWWFIHPLSGYFCSTCISRRQLLKKWLSCCNGTEKLRTITSTLCSINGTGGNWTECCNRLKMFLFIVIFIFLGVLLASFPMCYPIST